MANGDLSAGKVRVKKSDFASLFGGTGGGLGSLTALGIDANSLFDAIKVDFQDVKTTETSKTVDKATVHVTGKSTVTFDAAKMKEIFKKVMAANGQPASMCSMCSRER